MATVEQGIDIAAPIGAVFAAVTDPRRGSEWNHNVLEVSNISDMPVRQGTTWNQVTVMMGRPAKLTCRILQLDPPHQGLLEISGQYHAQIWTICQQAGEKTHVTQRIEFTPPGGVLGKVAALAVGPQLQKELAQTLVRQRDILEREARGLDETRTS